MRWLTIFVVGLLTLGLQVGSVPAQSHAQPTVGIDPDERLFNKFHKKIYPLLTHPSSGCVDCHNSEGTSSLVFSGNSVDDFRLLLDQQYLKRRGVDTLLSRITSEHAPRRMPKDADAWPPGSVRKLRNFIHEIEDLEERSGQKADESFPRSLLSPFRGEPTHSAEKQFLTFRQLRGKIQVLFQDDWIRGDRDKFAENIALFGGADFKTRFNESSQPSAPFLVGLDMLARDVADRAYEQESGPFQNWSQLQPLNRSESDVGESFSKVPSAELLSAGIDTLYQRLLFRSPTENERQHAVELVQSIYELEDTIRQRDDELVFELMVVDPLTQLSSKKIVSIPVRGETVPIQQFLLDQSTALSDSPSGIKSLVRQELTDSFYLDDKAKSRLVLHNAGTQRNVSFAGLELLSSDGELVQSLDVQSNLVELEGAWQIEDRDGFRSLEDRGQHKGSSSIQVSLDVPKPGVYRIAVKWRQNQRNAPSVLVEVFASGAKNILANDAVSAIPPVGQANFYFDCSNDTQPFASPPAVFQFRGNDSVEVRNSETYETVTAAAIGFHQPGNESPSFLIDSAEAEGSQFWKSFDAGRFKAYNVKGKLLHDDNSKKGELSLIYQPNKKDGKGWSEKDYYQLRVFYPGKKDQEVMVPLVIHASSSSPIIQVAAPRIGQSDCQIRLDASASYNVSHTPLRFHWKQIGGTRVPLDNVSLPVLEFIAPRKRAEQAAWTALCVALIRHPDFLFVKSSALREAKDSRTRMRLGLMKLCLDLMGRPPTHSELQALENGVSWNVLVDRILDSDEFQQDYFHRVRLYLESQGGDVQDEPARIWSYIAFHDRPFTEVLTADYTVDSKMQKVPRDVHHGRTGILTAPGFIQGKPGLPHYNYAAQVSMLFLGYVYEVPAEIVDQREGVTALGTTDPNSVCYSCHKILTPLSFQRLEWDDEGRFRTKDDDGNPLDASDQDAAEDYPFRGKGLEAFATQAVRKERFLRTMINVHVNFYFGRPMRFREDERVLYRRLWDNVHENNFRIRDLIRAIVNSPEYLN